ncbi:hypothetical protein F511_19304 [Dorcoceras hygrometricum]|uniref:Uncharacterized protein n=1 Tax=Dorcoceras hygrometricum TaxID=472368 RepID=A0A2Z7CSC7_9LAMI|nr:hypothetical protein F511_19304 [Dorcoceras hygrometricum]
MKEMKRRRAKESADGLSPAVARYQQRFALALKIQQMLFALITSRKIPVESYSGSSRRLRCFEYPVDKETAVARSFVTKNKQQLSEQLLNNLLKNIQPLQAINAQDGKNQWLK